MEKKIYPTLGEENIQRLYDKVIKNDYDASSLDKIRTHAKKLATATALGLSIAGVSTTAWADRIPAEKSMSTLKWDLVSKTDLWEYKALPSYNEATFLKKWFSRGNYLLLKIVFLKSP